MACWLAQSLAHGDGHRSVGLAQDEEIGETHVYIRFPGDELAGRRRRERFEIGIFLALAPWAVFGALAERSALTTAAVCALILSLLVAVRSARSGGLKILEVGAVVAFAGLAVAIALADPTTADWLARYARAISAALLALIAFGSLLMVPFTEQYARAAVPASQWSSPEFKQINRGLTAMWGFVFTLMVPAHVAAGAIDTHRANVLFNWVVPIALVLWAVKRTDSVRETAGGGA